MKAVNKEAIHGCMTGRPLVAVELDKQAYALLLDRSRKGIAGDWVLLGKSNKKMVRIGHTNPDELIRAVKDEVMYAMGGYHLIDNDEVTRPKRDLFQPRDSMVEAAIDFDGRRGRMRHR